MDCHFSWNKRAKNGKYTFTHIPAGLVYLPMGYQNDSLFPVDNPILATKDKRVQLLNPDFTQPITRLSFRRKFPIRKVLENSLKRNRGGIFQGANTRSFEDAVNLYTIHTTPYPGTNYYSFVKKGSYRYVRFIFPNGVCSVAEMHFTTRRDGNPSSINTLTGFLMSSNFEKDQAPQNITDKDPLSYFVAKSDSGGWVGFDLGKNQDITGVEFYPPNDGNTIERGGVYQLCYWDNGWQSKWKQQRANKEKLSFSNLPKNALFILHDLTKGRDERIFTFENRKQTGIDLTPKRLHFERMPQPEKTAGGQTNDRRDL